MDSKQGRKNRMAGQRFELKVRKDMESKKWIVDRWSNNVDFNFSKNYTKDTFPIKGKLIPAKSRFGLRTTGFPDFIAFTRTACWNCTTHGFGECGYEVIGIECKSNGYLSKEEKEKVKWLLSNNIFSKIYIASKGKKGEIIYKEVKNG